MSNSDAPVCVGIDDGFMETKVVLPNGTMVRIPSQSRAGVAHQVNISGAEATIFGYDTDDGPYVVGDIDDADSTKSDDYPLSAMNRVLVAHALRKAGLVNGERIYACSGMPVKRYYRASAPNRQAISAKKANLCKRDVVSRDGAPVPQILRHEVISEAIAAWFDLIFQRRDGVIIPDQELAAQKTAIIDMGGRTVDIAVIQDFNLDGARSSTIEVGMLDVQEAFRDALAEEYDVEPTLSQLNAAMATGWMRLFGKEVDVSALIEPAKAQIVKNIRAEVMRRLRKAGDIDRVVFAGGTAAALEDHLQDWFPHQLISPEPAFSNAKGMAKYAEYIMADR